MNRLLDCGRFVPKGWGYEQWLVNSDLYCSKKLFVAKGRLCSLHFHNEKDETFWLDSGKVMVCSYNHSTIDNGTALNYLIYITSFFNKFYSERISYLKNIEHIEWPYNILEPGDYIHIPPKTAHFFFAFESSMIIETSTRHRDEDSIRILDGDKC